MPKYQVKGMNTGFGKKIYTLMYWDGQGWISARPVRYYQTKAGAEKAAKKLNRGR